MGWFFWSNSNTVFNECFFNTNTVVLSNCNTSVVLRHFNSLFKLFEEEPYGYQRMAEIYNIDSGGNNIEHISSMATRAKSITKTIDLRNIASTLGVSYSKFRIDFKKQTDLTPLQYFLLLKIKRITSQHLNISKINCF